MKKRQKDVKFDSFHDLMIIMYPLMNRMTPKEFLDFIDGLDKEMLKNLVNNPEQSNRMNLLKAILDDLADYQKMREGINLIKKILKIIGTEYFEDLMNLVLDNEHYINLPILEALVYIDRGKTKLFLENTKHKFKFGFYSDPLWDFHLILYILLQCFNPDELMMYLDKFHRDDLFRIVLPKMGWFRHLKMSAQHELDMEHFIAAFFLEDAGNEEYFKNLEKLGLFLADIMLSEMSDRENEINEEINLRIVKALDWVGGEAEKKLENLSNQYEIEKYRDILY